MMSFIYFSQHYILKHITSYLHTYWKSLQYLQTILILYKFTKNLLPMTYDHLAPLFFVRICTIYKTLRIFFSTKLLLNSKHPLMNLFITFYYSLFELLVFNLCIVMFYHEGENNILKLGEILSYVCAMETFKLISTLMIIITMTLS
jgi:hypothetical protein